MLLISVSLLTGIDYPVASQNHLANWIEVTMDLANKTAFITGGASGLGLATARNFVAAGANVMLFDLNTESLEQAAKEFGGQAIWQAGDVAD